MREIKFRMWFSKRYQGEERPQMVYDGDVMNLYLGQDLNSSDHILLQYTGLKDKRGKEIYEGDIVKTHSGLVGFIEWEDEDCGFVVQNKYMVYVKIHEKLEVIGNRYDNPELLE